MEILPTEQFAKDLRKLGKKYPSIVSDLRQLQTSLLENPTQGIHLGNNCYKIRLKIAS
jgi:mRNA-degrading endonuclease RelE of RelBE toxin-antitoxin system